MQFYTALFALTVIATHAIRNDNMNHPAEYTWLQCRDVGNWADDAGDGCDWYTSEADDVDLLYYEESRCDYWGGYLGDYALGDIANLTALEACCGCGGGIPQFSLCNDLSKTNGSPWEDNIGRSCDVYDADKLCFEEGWANEAFGMTASEACCACGGGVIGTCENYPDFKTYDDLGCWWFGQSADDDGAYLDDPYYGYDDWDTRCAFWEDDSFGTYNGDVVYASEACCVCGGGIRSLDYPSYMPVDAPSNAPVGTPVDAPISTPVDAPISTPVDAPVAPITNAPSTFATSAEVSSAPTTTTTVTTPETASPVVSPEDSPTTNSPVTTVNVPTESDPSPASSSPGLLSLGSLTFAVCLLGIFL